MRNEIIYNTTKIMPSVKITEVINQLQQAKESGAEMVRLYYCNDPSFTTARLETYRKLSEEEIKQNKIEALKAELKELEE